MTNQSIGIDDENFDFYFKNNGVVASGRWGSWLLRKLLDTYSYLPVWRDFIGIIVLTIAAVVFLCIYEALSDKKLDMTISTIAVSIIISFPLIAKMFIYIDNSVETALCILFATVAYGMLCMETKRWGAMLASLGFLVIGCSIIENTLVYFCVEICFFH